MIGRIPPVTSVSATGAVTDAKVHRNDRVPTAQHGSLTVLAARTDLPATVGATVADGVWLNEATARYPGVVLGSVAAQRPGIGAVAGLYPAARASRLAPTEALAVP
jgi:putative ABC transport system permease protein